MEILIEFILEVIVEGIFSIIDLGIRKAIGERSYQVIKGVASAILSFIFTGFLFFMIAICMQEKNNILLWICTVWLGGFLGWLVYRIWKKEVHKKSEHN